MSPNDTKIAPDQLAKVRNAQAEVVNAFRAKHGLEPDDVGIDVRNLGDGRVVTMVRKLSANEREWRRTTALRKDVAAMSSASVGKPRVYFPGKLSWWQRALGRFTPMRVYLSEKGARDEGGGAGVIQVEVRA